MNRSEERAASLAKEFGGTVVPWGSWDEALLTPDVVVSSVAAEEPVLRRPALERVMGGRGNRALFLMDLGVPRNIEAAVSELYNCLLYTSVPLRIASCGPKRTAGSRLPCREIFGPMYLRSSARFMRQSTLRTSAPDLANAGIKWLEALV